jgi:chromosome partitioning protein
MQTWAIIAQKGGQSKTTIATAFAVEAAREGGDRDPRRRRSAGSALWSERRDTDDVMVKDSSVAGLPLHVSRGRDSGKVDLIIIDTPANSKDIAMLAAEQADFVVIPVAPRGLDVHSVLQTVKQVQQAGTPFAVILTQVPHQGGEGEARAASPRRASPCSIPRFTSARTSTRRRRSARPRSSWTRTESGGRVARRF